MLCCCSSSCLILSACVIWRAWDFFMFVCMTWRALSLLCRAASLSCCSFETSVCRVLLSSSLSDDTWERAFLVLAHFSSSTALSASLAFRSSRRASAFPSISLHLSSMFLCFPSICCRALSTLLSCCFTSLILPFWSSSLPTPSSRVEMSDVRCLAMSSSSRSIWTCFMAWSALLARSIFCCLRESMRGWSLRLAVLSCCRRASAASVFISSVALASSKAVSFEVISLLRRSFSSWSCLVRSFSAPRALKALFCDAS
mmetsp:Transcript_2758/g.6637  ORF Transcript_2758/g.6637 Transcript_2758/m.6637 type:complete len:257 (-) Transcript_2758:220-990(-)